MIKTSRNSTHIIQILKKYNQNWNHQKYQNKFGIQLEQKYEIIKMNYKQ